MCLRWLVGGPCSCPPRCFLANGGPPGPPPVGLHRGAELGQGVQARSLSPPSTAQGGRGLAACSAHPALRPPVPPQGSPNLMSPPCGSTEGPGPATSLFSTPPGGADGSEEPPKPGRCVATLLQLSRRRAHGLVLVAPSAWMGGAGGDPLLPPPADTSRFKPRTPLLASPRVGELILLWVPP